MPSKIFVSYTSRDREWAHWIGVTLRENGFVPLVHEWEVGAGDNIARWMDESLAVSDRLLGVFTNAYVNALYSSSERWAAYWDDPAGRKGYFIPIEVERVANWPPLTRAIKRLSLVGLSEAEAEHALLAFLAPPKSPTSRPPFPGPAVTHGAQTSRTVTPAAPLDRMLTDGETLPANRPAWPTAAVSRLLDLPNGEKLALVPMPAVPEHGVQAPFFICARPLDANLVNWCLDRADQKLDSNRRAVEVSRQDATAVMVRLAHHFRRHDLRLPTAEELMLAWSAGRPLLAEARVFGMKAGAEPHRANAWGVFVPPTGCSEWIDSPDHADAPNVIRLDGSGSATVCRQLRLDPAQGWPYVGFRFAISDDEASSN